MYLNADMAEALCYRVFVNGVEIPNAIEASEEEGYVTCVMMRQHPSFPNVWCTVPGGEDPSEEYLTYTLHGHVELRVGLFGEYH